MGEDTDAFREAMDGVQPLREAGKQDAARQGEPTAGQLQKRRNAVADPRDAVDPNFLSLGEVKRYHPHDVLEWKKDGVQPEVFKRLSAGKYPVDADLDLHRRTLKEARADVFAFSNQCNTKGWRCVAIAHGRGEKSPDPAKLKSYVAQWLIEIPEVIAYHSAPRNKGGTGATLVLFRKAAHAKEDNRERHGGQSILPNDLS